MKQTPFYYTLRRLLALSVMSLLTLATLSLTSCRHKDTEHDDYGLSAALSWADPAMPAVKSKTSGYGYSKPVANSWLSVSMAVSF